MGPIRREAVPPVSRKEQGIGQKRRNMARNRKRVRLPSCHCGRPFYIGHVHFIAYSDGLERVCCNCFAWIAGADESETVGYVGKVPLGFQARHELGADGSALGINE